MRLHFVIALSFVLLACGKEGSPKGGAASEEPRAAEPSAGAESAGRRMFIECPPESRTADICAEEYAPVCAQHSDGSTARTYSNACHACREQSVSGYFVGACETGENE
jgi:hypothetical protein